MAGNGVREAKFVRTPNFKETFAAVVESTPSIKERLKDFIAAKKKRPPDRFNNDHTLRGPLAGISECHLAHDACLLYTDKADTVTLLLICSHDDITGRRARSLAKKIKRQVK